MSLEEEAETQGWSYFATLIFAEERYARAQAQRIERASSLGYSDRGVWKMRDSSRKGRIAAGQAKRQRKEQAS